MTVDSANSSEERVESRIFFLSEQRGLYVIMQFETTLHDKRTVYKHTYDAETLGNTISQRVSLSYALPVANGCFFF